MCVQWVIDFASVSIEFFNCSDNVFFIYIFLEINIPLFYNHELNPIIFYILFSIKWQRTLLWKYLYTFKLYVVFFYFDCFGIPVMFLAIPSNSTEILFLTAPSSKNVCRSLGLTQRRHLPDPLKFCPLGPTGPTVSCISAIGSNVKLSRVMAAILNFRSANDSQI
jgi:hypothetical protein